MRKSEKTKVAVVAAKAPDVFVVPAPVPAASAQNRGSQGPTKGLSKSSSLDTSSMRAPSTPGKTLHSSAKTMEVPAELLAVPKSPRGMTVSVAEAQLMKSPKFVAQQLTREASEWLEYDRAFEGQGKHGLEEYEMLEPLGQGRFGAVRKCRERKTGETYAIKAISRDQSDDMATCIQHALVERRILSSLSHPYVCGFKVSKNERAGENFFFQKMLTFATVRVSGCGKGVLCARVSERRRSDANDSRHSGKGLAKGRGCILQVRWLHLNFEFCF